MAGADAFDKRDFATALERFQRAEALYKAPSISVMVARCLAQSGRLVEAVDKYETTLRMPLEAGAPEAFQRAVAEATVEVEGVRARVARLEVRAPAEPPAGLEVTLDGAAIPPALLGVPKPVDPGVHRVVARAAGRQPFSYELTLTEAERQTVEIVLPPLAAVATRSETPAPAPKQAGPSVLSISLLAGGGVALTVGAVTGLVALNHKGKLDEACNPGCPSDMSSNIDAFRLNRTISYVSFGVGLAAAGVGTYLLLHQSSSGQQVGALVLPGGAALAGSF